jgi:hypothetical protein
MATVLEAAIVRVHGAQGQIVGGGFLVEPDKVVTCAHVVMRALGLADDEPPPPTPRCGWTSRWSLPGSWSRPGWSGGWRPRPTTPATSPACC